jgi:hypothetical protein
MARLAQFMRYLARVRCRRQILANPLQHHPPGNEHFAADRKVAKLTRTDELSNALLADAVFAGHVIDQQQIVWRDPSSFRAHATVLLFSHPVSSCRHNDMSCTTIVQVSRKELLS